MSEEDSKYLIAGRVYNTKRGWHYPEPCAYPKDLYNEHDHAICIDAAQENLCEHDNIAPNRQHKIACVDCGELIGISWSDLEDDV